MGEAAEATDDVAMPFGMGEVGLSKTPCKGDGSLLVGQALGMPKRQIKEERQLRLDCAIMSGFDGGMRDPTCQDISGIHSQRSSERIARELVEQQHQCQGSL